MKTQIWIALSIYVLVAIVKKRLSLDISLYKLLQILSITLFEKMPISTALFDVGSQFDDIDNDNQLELFDLWMSSLLNAVPSTSTTSGDTRNVRSTRCGRGR